MSQDISSNSQPIPLSQGKKNRRESHSDDAIKVSETRLRAIMSEVINQEVSSKITRLENSINKMMLQFEEVKNGNAEDAALRVTTNSDAADLALANVTLATEDMYPYFCQTLADQLGIRKHDVIQMIKQFGLRHNAKYHLEIKQSENSTTNKWSEETYERLREALDNGEYPRPDLLRKNT